MPLWVAAVLAYPPAMGIATVLALRAARRPQGLYSGLIPFRVSVGDQAERWLRAQEPS